jgi:hypothetical protein
MTDDDAIIAGEDDPARSQPSEMDPEENEIYRIEHDGQVYELPAALKGGFLRQADYTRKTQELAEHRRALLAERQAVAAQSQLGEGALADRAHLAALDQQVESFAGVDWQGLAHADPHRAQALWAQFQQTQALRQQYGYALSHHEARGQLHAAQEAAAKMAETGRALSQEIEGWSPEVAAKLVEYAKAFGVTHEELTQMADARLWKVLHKAYQADRANQEEGAANAAAKAQAVRPAVLVSGSAAGSGGVRDELATKEWMQRRNDIVRRGR